MTNEFPLSHALKLKKKIHKYVNAMIIIRVIRNDSHSFDVTSATRKKKTEKLFPTIFIFIRHSPFHRRRLYIQ